MPSDIIWSPYDGNSEEGDTKSDLGNAAYAINIAAIVRGSLSNPDGKKKKLNYWFTASSEV